MISPGLVQGLLTGLPDGRTQLLCCGITCCFRRTVLVPPPTHRGPLPCAALPARLPSCSQPALSPRTITATLAGFGRAVLDSLDWPFCFPARASAAAVDEDASLKATTTTNAAAQPRQGGV